MSGDENFLERWSRRKRDAASETREQLKPQRADDESVPESSAANLSPGETQPAFDPANLPPIESIGAGSDIRAFLAAGVPADLTRAALRRAWSSDPTIRDFVGLSENSWDFNEAGAMPGFGAIGKEEVQRLMTYLTGELDTSIATERPLTAVSQADQVTKGTRESGPDPQRRADTETDLAVPNQEQRSQDRNIANAGNNVVQRDKIVTASQYDPAPRGCSSPVSRRRHGGALPE